MALAANISALTDELIEVVTNTFSEKNSLRFRALKRRVEETIKSGARGRTDQFAVAEHLEGLQEKFQVLGRDELADALRTRLEELDQHRSTWFPEILSLLLQLSDRPALFSNLDRIEASKPSEPEIQLTGPGSEASESAYCDDENIWEHIDFGAQTSDDDLSTVSSEISVPRILPQSPVAPEDGYVAPEEVFSSGEDENLITSITKAQFWKTEDKSTPRQNWENYSRVITEAQIIRQIIFMLQGLPTSLFWRLDEKVEVDRRYALSHSPNNALASLLRLFSLIGAKLDTLRRFTQAPQSIPYVQTFHRGVEDCLRKFDAFLSKIEAQHLCQSPAVSVSLLQLLEDVRRESRLLLLLADLVSSLNQDASQEPAQCLNLLYELVCMCQATGADGEFQYLARLFFTCFETYTRSIRLWMETGQLDSEEGSFFVVKNCKGGDLRTLWHDWYTLDESSLLAGTPKFLHSVSQKIFTTGKTVFFLRQLDALPENLVCLKWRPLVFEDIYPPGLSTPFYLPFSELLKTAFEKLVDTNYSAASDALRNELCERCGFWASLQALELIYLCRDMSVLSPFDNKIFELIDRGRGAWNDRFLLTELGQSAFSTVPFVDPSRLIVRSQKGSHWNFENNSRSVNVLRAVSIDYTLPWPVANVITKDAILTYQRIFTFLMQIRRARYLTAKQRLRSSNSHAAINGGEKKYVLGYALRHNLLWFLNVLYSHMTDLVISTTMHSMQQALSASKDIDAMIATHRSHISSLEEQLLLSENLTPIYKTVINILDLCVHFADIQATHHGENNFDQTGRVFGRSDGGRSAARHLRQGRYGEGLTTEDGGDLGSEYSDIDSDVDEGNNTGISFHESPYLHQLKDLKDQFDQLASFMVAGLKGVGRINGQQSWEILAEKLEWRKGREGAVLV